jgi:hypothetical protein
MGQPEGCILPRLEKELVFKLKAEYCQSFGLVAFGLQMRQDLAFFGTHERQKLSELEVASRRH